jgi:adenine C2-methylase RlmN of 23S rRNA A2503 and tRNA A37
VELLTSHQGLGLAPRRITVSTAGIAKMIKKLGDDEANFHLALSLHAANDEKRNKIMPINEQNSFQDFDNDKNNINNIKNNIPFNASALEPEIVSKFNSLGPLQGIQELGMPVLFNEIHLENRYISAK